MKKTPEHQFVDLIGDYQVELSTDKFPSHFNIFNMNNKLILQHNQDDGYTFIDNYMVNIKNQLNDIDSFMKTMLLNHFNIKDTIPEKNWFTIALKQMNKIY